MSKGTEIHEGHYFDDQKNGAFKIQHTDGESYEGEYRDNKRYGTFIEKLADGRIAKGKYEDGKENGPWDWYQPATDTE